MKHERGDLDPISTLSSDEQARLLKLAGLALHDVKPEAENPLGYRAKEDHRKLEKELEDALERLKADKNEAA